MGMEAVAEGTKVSILTDPEGPVKHSPKARATCSSPFQSSPIRKDR